MITNQDLEFVRNYSKRKRARDEILDRIRERVDVHSVQYDKILAKGGPERDRMAEHVAAIDEAERRWTAETIEDDRRYIRICEEIGRLPQPENDVYWIPNMRPEFRHPSSIRCIRKRISLRRSCGSKE